MEDVPRAMAELLRRIKEENSAIAVEKAKRSSLRAKSLAVPALESLHAHFESSLERGESDTIIRLRNRRDRLKEMVEREIVRRECRIRADAEYERMRDAQG